MRFGYVDGFFKTKRAGHERGRGNGSGFVAFEDGTIYALSEAEIVGVDDETLHVAV